RHLHLHGGGGPGVEDAARPQVGDSHDRPAAGAGSSAASSSLARRAGRAPARAYRSPNATTPSGGTPGPAATAGTGSGAWMPNSHGVAWSQVTTSVSAGSSAPTSGPTNPASISAIARTLSTGRLSWPGSSGP